MKKLDIHNLRSISNPEALLEKIYNMPVDELQLPIDLDEITSSLNGINVSSRLSFDDFDKSGYVKVERSSDNRFTGVKVWVNPSEIGYRRRFTLAHELGHVFNDVLPAIDDIEAGEEFIDRFNRGKDINPIETRANRFAARLLMPSKLISKEIEKLSEQTKAESRKLSVEEAIRKLAGVFDVSSEAMRYRLKNLGYDV